MFFKKKVEIFSPGAIFKLTFDDGKVKPIETSGFSELKVHPIKTPDVISLDILYGELFEIKKPSLIEDAETDLLYLKETLRFYSILTEIFFEEFLDLKMIVFSNEFIIDLPRTQLVQPLGIICSFQELRIDLVTQAELIANMKDSLFKIERPLVRKNIIEALFLYPDKTLEFHSDFFEIILKEDSFTKGIIINPLETKLDLPIGDLIYIELNEIVKHLKCYSEYDNISFFDTSTKEVIEFLLEDPKGLSLIDKRNLTFNILVSPCNYLCLNVSFFSIDSNFLGLRGIKACNWPILSFLSTIFQTSLKLAIDDIYVVCDDLVSIKKSYINKKSRINLGLDTEIVKDNLCRNIITHISDNLSDLYRINRINEDNFVEHREFGCGRIKNQRNGGFELYVEFYDGNSRWVRIDEVRFISRKYTVPNYQKKIVKEDFSFSRRRLVESLRLGTVQPYCIEEFVFGRGKEIEFFQNWLQDFRRKQLILLGEYGSGKTHFLEYIRMHALKNNWAVSLVRVDPNETSFHKPKSVYTAIIRSLRINTRPDSNFRDLMKQIASHKVYYEVMNHPYLGKLIKSIRENHPDLNVLWNWIEGEPVYGIQPSMYTSSTSANVYCNIISAIGWSVKNLLDMKGFLILFDEAENTNSMWYTSYQDEKLKTFLRGLIYMSNDSKELLEEDIVENVYNRGLYGSLTNLRYCGHSKGDLRFIWRIPCFVKLIFAFTPDETCLSEDYLRGISTIELQPLKEKDLQQLAQKLVKDYEIAYQSNCTKISVEEILKHCNRKEKIRLFVKELIEILDLVRHGMWNRK